jgi:cation-transporting ATPase E
VDGVHPVSGVGESEMIHALAAVAASARSANKTTEALRVAYPSRAYPLAGEIPFSSVRKWSAVTFAPDPSQPQTPRGTYVLGAPEMLIPRLQSGAEAEPRRAIGEQTSALAEKGLRVLLLAYAPEQGALADEGDASALPADMAPLGLVALGDELRPEAREALSAFARAGVHLKIISGDNAQTVAALATQAGMDPELQAVSGQELERMSSAEVAIAAESATVFGRITPQQKEQLVRALRANGHYVAMIGDGANDVLSLKQADLGIAMRSGSHAARGVADVVLMQDSFAVLAPAVAEGQRILNGMQAILKLFLTRICTIGLVIFSSLVVGAFPLELRQGSLVTFFSVGVPSIALAVWAHPGPRKREALVRQLVHFIVPPTLLTGAIGLLLFVGTYEIQVAQMGSLTHSLAVAEDYSVAQSTLTSFLVVTGLLLIVLVQPPTRWWAGGSALSTDRRPAWLAAGMMALFVVISLVPPLRAIFALSALGLQEYLLVAATALIWLLAVRETWRRRLLSRYLSVDVGAA